MRRHFGALLALALALPSAAGATVPAAYPPTTATSPGGLRLVAQPDSDASLSGVSVFVSAGLERQSPSTNGAAALVAECIARTPVDAGDGQMAPLTDVVTARGGSLSYAVDDRTAHFYLESRPDRMPELIGLFAKVLAHPDFTAPTLGLARKTLAQRSAEGEKNPLRVGIEMFKESYLPAGLAYPDYGTSASLASLGPAQLQAFFAQTYRRGTLSASAVGVVTPQISNAVGALAQSVPDGTLAALSTHPQELTATPKQVVVHRDVAAPFVVLGFGAPPPGDRDFGAMLVLESLLSRAFERAGATTVGLGEKSVDALYLYNTSPASLVVYVNGASGLDPSLGLREILSVAKSLATKPLAADVLRTSKAQAVGAFVTGTTTLADRAYLIGLFADDGVGSASINRPLDAIDAVTTADVQRAAKRYLQRCVVAIVLPRQTVTP